MEKGQGKGTDTLQTDNVFTRKEYIEREAAIASAISGRVQYGTEGERWIRQEEVREILQSIPVADVVPVRHGKWLEHRSWAKCSECEFLIGFETTYCPNCGALMDKDGDGE